MSHSITFQNFELIWKHKKHISVEHELCPQLGEDVVKNVVENWGLIKIQRGSGLPTPSCCALDMCSYTITFSGVPIMLEVYKGKYYRFGLNK